MKKIMITLFFLLGIILFLPLPYYQKEDARCDCTKEIAPCLCPKKGWHFTKPLIIQLITAIKYRSLPTRLEPTSPLNNPETEVNSPQK